MVAQTIQFDTVSVSEVGSGTITAFLFSGTTLTATLSSIAESGTLKGRYTGTVADIAAGDYRLVVKLDGYTISEPNEAVSLLLAVGTYVATAGVVLDSAGTAKLNEILVAVEAIDAGGGALSPEQVAQLQRIEALASRLSGSPVTVNGNVKPGGQIVLKHGDNHTVALLNPVPVPVEDIGGSLHTLMAAVGVNNIGVAAIRGSDPASRISGTVAALNYASNLLTVTMEFPAAESSKGVVGPVYTYDVFRLDNPSRTFFSGKLTVTRDARSS